MKKYYVFSEGYQIVDYKKHQNAYIGNIELRPVTVELDEDGDVFDWEWSEGNEEQEYITDKWSGDLITDFPDDFYDYHTEFTNGLINHGFFDTYEEAKKEFDAQITGEIKYNELNWE